MTDFMQRTPEELARKELVDRYTITVINIRQRFKGEIKKLIYKYFPKADDITANMLINYLIEENLGLGKIEILLQDPALEEIVINNHKDPVWVYHRRHGWVG